MSKRNPKRPQPASEPKSSSKQEKPQTTTFTEIGGSPVPGLTLRHVLRGHTKWIGRIAWSPDGSYLASPSDDRTIRIWDAHSGACVQTLEGHTNTVISVAWSPDGQRLASASYDKTIRLWDPTNGKALQMLETHAQTVNSVAFSSDGRWLASKGGYGGIDEGIRLWRCDTRACVAELAEEGADVWPPGSTKP